MSINERITPPSWMKNPHPTVYGWVDKFTGEVLMRIRDIPNPDLTYTQMNAKGPYPKVSPSIGAFIEIDTYGEFTTTPAPTSGYARYTSSPNVIESIPGVFGFASVWDGEFATSAETITIDFITPAANEEANVYSFVFSQSDFHTTGITNESDAVLVSIFDNPVDYDANIIVRNYETGSTTINSIPLTGLSAGTNVRIQFNINEINVYDIDTQSLIGTASIPGLFVNNNANPFNVFLTTFDTDTLNGDNVVIDVKDPTVMTTVEA